MRSRPAGSSPTSRHHEASTSCATSQSSAGSLLQFWQDVLKTREGGELPKTLTEMYIHFLVVQSKLKNIKAASVYSGVFTQIFKEERGLYQDKVFCFIHLSVQEFLAALHVHLTFINSGVNLLAEAQKSSQWSKLFREKPKLQHLHQFAVDKALKSPNGHLDMFLRFLLGLSLQTNQSLLHHLVTEKGNGSKPNKKTMKYIKKKINKNLPPERSINLFYCLNELKDHSLVEKIQQYQSSGRLTRKDLSPAQWSALAFMLLSSENNLDVFDLKKFSASEEVLLRMLAVVKASKKTLLSGCNLSERSCEALASVLSSHSCNLRELDLSNNDLKDAGVNAAVCWTAESTVLSGCNLSERSCEALASVLSSHSCNLRELDLSNNDLKDSGVKLLSAGLQSPHCKMEILSVDHGGEQRLEPGMRKYACGLTLDPNTTHRYIKLSDNNRKMTAVNKKQPYPVTEERFHLPVAVYLDCPAGTLSFYRVSSGRLTHLYTFNSTFTKPLYPGFGFGHDSSATICEL
ncbi:hypothetical protein L3Q82_001490 [Scortum barcoo]|uniref:Uncharacterized protein n=1 Tax=Scortum barcoo TaxID=214431 RepID=A0ACB8W7N4_9TELE|nr:hypothetical protein L3Q82_001490 [Scortum barcoo]